MIDKLFATLFPHYHTLTEEEKHRVKYKPLVFITIAVLVMGSFLYWLNDSKNVDQNRWSNTLNGDLVALADMPSVCQDATEVLCGTYIDNIYNMNMAHGSYSVDFLVWFRWKGDDIKDMANSFHIPDGTITKLRMIKDYVQDGEHYQQAQVHVNLSRNFTTRSFPLDSHQLPFYIEPNLTAKRVILVADKENSNVDRTLNISGYLVTQHDVNATAYEYRNTRSDMQLEGIKNISSRLVTCVQIARDGLGIYLKCFIGLFGCLTWALIVLYLSSYHRVDPLAMLPAALFGCVANLMVGASLLPAALEMGLLEYTNIWGIFIILSVAIIIMGINDSRRKKNKDKSEINYYPEVYSRLMFYVVVAFAVVGNILLPLSVYLNK